MSREPGFSTSITAAIAAEIVVIFAIFIGAIVVWPSIFAVLQ